MSLLWKAVPPAVASLYRGISAALRGSDFYLAGGTALALQIGHRISADLDLFSPTFHDPEALARLMRSDGLELEVTLEAKRTLYIESSAIKASFFGLDARMLQPLVEPGEGVLPLADTDDIAAMKLVAVAGRGSRRDFVDLWFLARDRHPLDELVELYRRKYPDHDAGHLLRALTYFADAEQEPPLRMLRPAPWSEVKADLRRWVAAITS